MLEDTIDWVDPAPHERWLDLRCGGGAITWVIWERTMGKVRTVVGLDCAAANDHLLPLRARASLPERAWRVLRYGCWLKGEPRTGRFHYLPAAEENRRLIRVGFVSVAHRLS